MSAAANQTPLKDRLIPWYFVMAFAVVFAVNGVFVYLATSTNQGVVTENPYEKGLAYDVALAEKRAQEALGWQGEITYDEGLLRFTLSDAAGQPISGATISAHIERPIEKGIATEQPLTESTPGVYEAELPFPAQGQWDITISSLWKKQYHQTRKRLVVR